MAYPSLFKKISVVSTTFADGNHPDVNMPFGNNGLSFYNEDASNIVEVSFDGINVHDELNPAFATRGIIYDNRSVGAIWFRLKAGSSAVVAVRAW